MNYYSLRRYLCVAVIASEAKQAGINYELLIMNYYSLPRYVIASEAKQSRNNETLSSSPAGTGTLLTAGFSLRKGNAYAPPSIPQVPQGLAVWRAWGCSFRRLKPAVNKIPSLRDFVYFFARSCQENSVSKKDFTGLYAGFIYDLVIQYSYAI